MRQQVQRTQRLLGWSCLAANLPPVPDGIVRPLCAVGGHGKILTLISEIVIMKLILEMAGESRNQNGLIALPEQASASIALPWAGCQHTAGDQHRFVGLAVHILSTEDCCFAFAAVLFTIKIWHVMTCPDHGNSHSLSPFRRKPDLRQGLEPSASSRRGRRPSGGKPSPTTHVVGDALQLPTSPRPFVAKTLHEPGRSRFAYDAAADTGIGGNNEAAPLRKEEAAADLQAFGQGRDACLISQSAKKSQGSPENLRPIVVLRHYGMREATSISKYCKIPGKKPRNLRTKGTHSPAVKPIAAVNRFRSPSPLILTVLVA
jgi:hypothetical protein